MTRGVIQLVIGLGFAIQAGISVPVEGAGPGFLVVAGVAWLTQWGLLWLAYRAFLARPWWRAHPVVSALVILVIVVLAAIVSIVALPAWSDTTGWTILWRWSITLVVTALLVSLGDYRDDLVRERRLQEQLRESREQAAGLVEAERRSIVERLLDMLQQAFDATSMDAAGSERLQHFAREQVRPLSHELAEAMPPLSRSAPVPDARSSWREVLSDVTSRPLIRPWAMSIVVTLLYILTTVQLTTAATPASPPEGSANGTGVGVSVDLTTFLPAMAALLLVFILTLAVSWAAVRVTTPLLPRLSLGMRAMLAVLTVLAVALVVTLAVYGVLTLTGARPVASRTLGDQAWVVASVVVIASAIVVTRSIASLLRQSSQRLRELNEELEWETTRLNNALSQERQFFATQLHGPIQSAAAAAALRLHHTDATTDALQQVESDLRSAVEALGEGPPQSRDIESELADLAAMWAGVCEVHVTVPDSVIDAVNADWIAVGTVRDLLVDAVANAAMHGHAAHVWITGDWSAAGEIEFTIVDDGSAGLGEDRGLGTALLDAACVRWSREAVDGGVRLNAVTAVPVGS